MQSYAVIAIAGVGDSTTRGGTGVKSPSPELLFSLGTALALLLALLSLSPASRTPSLVSLSPCSSSICTLGARHAGSCHWMPVKLFSCSGWRSHRRHGAPERSRARRPALIAPVLALGPSRWLFAAVLGCSAVPSSLM